MTATYELATSLHNFAGDFFQNVFAYQLTEAGSASPFEYADALIDKWKLGPMLSYLPLFGDDVILDFISAKKSTDGGGPSATQIIQGTGGGADLCIGAGLAFDVAWQTAAASNRPGHSYIAAAPNGSLIGGQWIPAYIALIDTWIGDMLPPLTLAGALGNATFGVYSRKLAQFNVAQHGIKKPKPTMLNKRTLPLL